MAPPYPIPVVDIEEIVTRYIPPNNGAGPLWCYGSPAIIREGERLFLSVMETDPHLDRLCKTRWQLFCRDEEGWTVLQHGAHYDEREPCPLVRLPDGRLILSVNPLADETSMDRGGPCIPHILVFDTSDTTQPPLPNMPIWDRSYESFSEHSYRGVGADYANEMLLLLNIDAHEGYPWSLMDRTGAWIRQGNFSFPIRACYPQVGLHSGTAHVLAVGDIIETNETWRAYKQEKTGRHWDYDFRRLFYTWTPDIRMTDFLPSIEIDSRESTAGHIRNLDMWIDQDGAAHILYATKNIWHDFMRDRFFPGTPLVSTMEYRVVREGRVVTSQTLDTHIKDESTPEAAQQESGLYYTGGAFHVDPAGTLRAFFTAGDTGTRMMQVHPCMDDTPVPLDITTPLSNFSIPTPRNGSEPSYFIDMYGTCREPDTLHYVRLRLDH